MENEEFYRRLSAVLTPLEMRDLVEAIESVITKRNGYGKIAVEIERRRLIQIAVTSTVKPGVS